MAETMHADCCSMCDARSSIGQSLCCGDVARSMEPGRAGRIHRAMARRSGSAEPVEAPKSTEVDRLGFPETPKSIEVGRSGSVQAAKIGRACARGAPRSVQGCAEVIKIDAKSCRGATKREGSYAPLVCEAQLEQFLVETRRFSALLPCVPTL